jgi:zinc protease
LAQSIGNDLKNLGDKARKSIQDAASDAAAGAKNDLEKAVAKAAWNPDAPLPTDSRLIRGTLPNGLSYIVVQHNKPEQHTLMWLHVQSGSMNEKESQRGLAHYLEHMAFNGSEHFPPGTLVKYFESIGMRFGGDLNAFTNYDQTTFQLNIPFTDDESVSKGMSFLSDVAFRLSLLPKEIDDERQIILNEKMTRKGAQQRIGDYVTHRIAPGSLVGERVTIGTEERIKGVQKPDFVDYYSHWYVPSNMTVIVVADAEPARIVEQIRQSFADGKASPRPTPQDPKITPYDATRAIVATDPEMETASVEIVRMLPGIPAPKTEGQLRDEMVTSFATAAFNRRIQAKLAKGDQPYMSMNVRAGRFHQSAAYSTSAGATGKPENWQKMLDALGTEVQRARLHGFSRHEIDAIRTQQLSDAEEAVKRESSRQASQIIGEIDSSLTSGDVITSAAQDLDLARRILPTITAEEVSKRFEELYEPVNVTYILEAPSSATVPTESDLVALGNKALSVRPEREAEDVHAASLIGKLPEPGKVAESSTHDASRVWSAWLDNGVRVHQRTMDEQKDNVSITITLAGGTIQETAANRGITTAAELAWSRPATSTLSSTDIRELMNGKKVRVGGGGFGGGGRRGGRGGGGGGALDALTLRVSGSPADLETGMQLAYLLLTDPVIEQSAFDQWKTRQLQSIARREKTLLGVAGLQQAQALYPAGEARLHPVTAAQIDALTRDAAQAWLRTLIATAPIEVSIVGDMPREEVMSLVDRYLGSLPKRVRISSTTLASLRNVPVPKGPIVRDQTVDTETDQAIVRAGFFGPDATNVPDVRALQMAGNILSSRMVKTIREEKNLVYSIGAQVQPGRALPGFGMFLAAAPAEPKNATPLADTVHEMFMEFAKNGPTEGEMTVAKKQFANAITESMKTAGFWSGVTETIDYHGAKLDNAVDAPAAFQSLTAQQVHAAFAKYCTEANWVSLIVRPSEEAVKRAKERKEDGGDTE